MVHEKSFRKESHGKFNSKAAKNSVIRGRVINHSVLISSISRLLSMQDEDTSEILLVYNISTNLVFLLDLWSLRALCLGHKSERKKLGP